MTPLQYHKTLISCHCHSMLKVVISWRWHREDVKCQQSETLVLRKVWVDVVRKRLRRHQIQRNTSLLPFYHGNIWLHWKRDEKLCDLLLCDCLPPHHASSLTDSVMLAWFGLRARMSHFLHEPQCLCDEQVTSGCSDRQLASVLLGCSWRAALGGVPGWKLPLACVSRLVLVALRW